MPRGGRLSIATRNAQVSEADAASEPELAPGDYVILAVSDTGVGMDPSTRKHIFEPFFTTKGKGEGTGLGLAIVYGIARQSRGWIQCDSAPGQGSTFSLYLPAADSADAVADPADVARGDVRGTETILLVEDQPNVRQLAATVLRGCGYQILEAGDAESALTVARNHEAQIDLLLTDVILPGLTGKDLADRLQDVRPGLTVLFMSGYTEDVIAHRGVIDPGLHYLPKPFTPRRLAEKVREVLDLPKP
jgi:CheY-like chemotaxis protein